MPTVSGSFGAATLVESGATYQLNSGLVSRILTLDGLYNTYGLVPTGDTGATEVILATQRTGAAVPLGATIDGITINVWRVTTSSLTTVTDSVIQLVKGGTIVGDNKATSTQYPLTVTMASYGGATDLWGTTWSVSEVNATNWGVAIAGAVDDTVPVDGGLPFWDYVTFAIDYTEAAVPPDPAPNAKRYWLDGGGEYAQRFANGHNSGHTPRIATGTPTAYPTPDVSDFSEFLDPLEDD